MRNFRGMVVTQARALPPALEGWTPHVPSEPQLNAYLNIFNDADIAAQKATQMRPTDERDLNVAAPLLWHFGPPPDGWMMQPGVELQGLGACRPGDEFCDERTQQPKMATRIPVLAPRVTTAARTAAYAPPTIRTNIAVRPSSTASSTPTMIKASSATTPSTTDSGAGYQIPADQAPSESSGSTGFPWWLLAVIAGGYLWTQR